MKKILIGLFVILIAAFLVRGTLAGNDYGEHHCYHNCYPTHTPTVTQEPTPTINPCNTQEEYWIETEPCPTVTIEPTVEVTQPPQEHHDEGPLWTSSTETSECGLSIPETVNQRWYTNYEVAGDSASLVLHWGTNDRYPTVNIAYGENKGEWRYGKLGVENNGSTTIEKLKPYQSYWFQIAYSAGLCVGQFSEPIDP